MNILLISTKPVPFYFLILSILQSLLSMFEKIVLKTLLIQAGPGLAICWPGVNTLIIFSTTMIFIDKDVLKEIKFYLGKFSFSSQHVLVFTFSCLTAICSVTAWEKLLKVCCQIWRNLGKRNGLILWLILPAWKCFHDFMDFYVIGLGILLLFIYWGCSCTND